MSVVRRSALLVVAAVGLILAYLRMARAFPINGDGASNALQAYDMFHGNPLLHGWTLSDVSFYPTELVQYGLVQLVYGLNADQVHVTAAITYTMIVFLAAFLAKGRATGIEAAVRIGLTVAIVLVPVPGTGYQVLLSSPNHTGSAVPLLLVWLVVDRAAGRRFLPVAVALLLAWGAIGDPLITFVGAVPLVLVSLLRIVRGDEPWRTRWRGSDAQLVLAGLVAVLLAHGFLQVLQSLGGYSIPAPPTSLSPTSDWPERAHMTARMLGVVFGTHRPGWQPELLQDGLSGLHFVGVAVAVGAMLVAIGHSTGRTIGENVDRINAVLVVAIACDVGAEVVSTLSVDLKAAREIAPVLPMAAVLAGRIWGPRLALAGLRSAAGLRGALAGVLVVLTVVLVAYAPPRAVPAEGQVVADWLLQRNLTYGLGAYWASNNITVTTERKVTVVPIIGGRDRVFPYCWQSATDMYDARRHDARFLVFELDRPFYGTPDEAEQQYGPPVQRQDVGRFAVLVYDVNLLEKLPAPC